MTTISGRNWSRWRSRSGDSGVASIRLAAGTAVLLIFAFTVWILAPAYVANWQLQQYLKQLAANPATISLPPDSLKIRILNRAAVLGLPVHSSDVQIKPSHRGVGIEIFYVVHVRVAGYSVDLHFRPEA
jgi:hypothetical protein